MKAQLKAVCGLPCADTAQRRQMTTTRAVATSIRRAVYHQRCAHLSYFVQLEDGGQEVADELDDGLIHCAA